jgi:hypothetical protein
VGRAVVAVWRDEWLQARVECVDYCTEGTVERYVVSEPSKRGVVWAVAVDEIKMEEGGGVDGGC